MCDPRDSRSSSLSSVIEEVPESFIFSQARRAAELVVPDSFPEKEESLLKMFNAEMFTSAYLIEYLHRMYEVPGVHEYLVGKLYSMPHQEMDFYITFIINMVINKQSSALETFLGQLSEQSMSFYLKMAWSLQAYCECSKLKSFRGWQERMEKLERLIEMGMVNSPVTKEVLALATKDKISDSETQWIMEKFKDKEHRSNYSGILNKFVNNLIKISLYLKQYAETQRKLRLKEYIEKLNSYLLQNRIQHKGIHYYQGIMIPFKKSADTPFHSNLIVSIIEEEFICFNTKKRAPYKIIFETVDLEEVKLNGSKLEKSLDSRKQSCESTDGIMDELDGVKNENAAEIDKEIFKGLAPWAEKYKKEQMRKVKKGLLRKLLSFKKRENVEQYTMHKLDKLVEEEVLHTAVEQQQQQQQLQQSQLQSHSSQNGKTPKKAKVNLENYSTGMAEFNAKFPTKATTTPSRSLRSKSTVKDDTHSTKKQRSFSSKEIKIKDVVNFFKGLRSSYPEKLKKINEMYKGLHYDVIESTVYALSSASSNQKVVSEKKKPLLRDIQVENRANWPWGQRWSTTQARLKAVSQYKDFASYQLRPFIIKGGDDLRQELLAMDLILKFHSIFKEANLPLYLRPYEIIVASESSGFIEFMPNTLSIDALKKKEKNFQNLRHFFEKTFEEQFDEAQKNFIESLAAYSVVAYLLQIKDRHNGNILIDEEGHIIHIDFGFVLSIAPGSMKFETAHFKLTKEYVSIMGGLNSDHFSYYKSLLVRAFIEIKKHVNAICTLVQIMVDKSNLPCFSEFDMIQFRGRFKENFTDQEFMSYVDDLVKGSYDRWSTNSYDKYQLMTNGILP